MDFRINDNYQSTGLFVISFWRDSIEIVKSSRFISAKTNLYPPLTSLRGDKKVKFGTITSEFLEYLNFLEQFLKHLFHLLPQDNIYFHWWKSYFGTF